jgi:dihydroxyacetone kinase
MTRIFNDPRVFKDDMVEGFVLAYSRYVRRVPDTSAVMAVDAPFKDKVAVVIGGGSGHYPAFCGYVGDGLAAAAVIGDIFTSPSAEQAYRCAKAVDSGAGVLFSYGNYSGDIMNFGMAEARCNSEGMDVRTVLVTDDVASAPPDDLENRRGIAGDFYVFKVAGAAAWRGDPLNKVEAMARHANAMTRSFGVAFDGCTLPGKSEPLFTVEPGKMELGLGVHGEPGIQTGDMVTGRELGKLMADKVLADTPQGAGNRVAILVNGLGSTKYEELFVLYSSIANNLTRAGLELHEPIVGEAVTSLDMAGCSLTLMWLDKELQALHDAPCSTPAYTRC